MGIFEALLELIFPPRCFLCDELLSADENNVCHSCSIGRFLLENESVCEKCGRLILKGKRCSLCSTNVYAFDMGWGLLQYEGYVHSAIYRLKYSDRRDTGKAMGRFMAKKNGVKIKGLGIEAIIPIPLHKKRFKQRGYNQAAVIAKAISSELNIPMDEHVLNRIKWTVPQSKLSPKARKSNLEGAFLINKPVRYKRILLIDDIYTTGNTMHQCAKILKEAGIQHVYFYTVAIANEQKEEADNKVLNI